MTETIEDYLLLLRIDADAGVLNGDLYPALCDAGPQDDFSLVGKFYRLVEKLGSFADFVTLLKTSLIAAVSAHRG